MLKKILGLLAITAACVISVSVDSAGIGTRAYTISEPYTISIETRKTGSQQPLIMAPFKTMDTFISEEKTADFTFSSIGGSWKEVAPDGTQVDVEVRFREGDRWTDWIEVEEEQDRVVADRKYGMASTGSATAFQYKFLLYGDGTATPTVSNIDWTFINSASNSASEVVVRINPEPKHAAFVATATQQSSVISRTQWGADESYRYMKDNSVDPVLIEIDPSVYEKYKDELQYSRVEDTDSNGDKYRWPLQYPEKITKIIVHHTATSGNLDNPAQAIRDIYYYHAVTRAWGDIGYNYIVDRDGKIYEGRAGGEGVIGAHSGIGNNGSIGIAVLGNYQNEDISEKIIVSLSEFIYKKAKIHDIYAGGFSEFRGVLRDNIMGHRDIMATQCPGEFLYQKLPVVRKLAAMRFNVKEKFVKDYDYQDLTELYYLELKPEETKDVELTLENIGKIDWNSSTFVVVDREDKVEETLDFPTRVESMLAPMEESLVKPGEKATFNFQVKAGKLGKTVYVKIAPVMNGHKSPDYIEFPVAVQPPVYKYELVDQQLPPTQIKVGEKGEGWVKLRNNGNVTWSGIRLQSESLRIDVPMEETEVAPDAMATFNFNFDSNTNLGAYQENLYPVLEGVNFISSDEITFETVIYEQEYQANLFSKTANNKWQKGETYNISVKLRNLGIKSWDKKDLALIVWKEPDLKVTDLSMSPNPVNLGDVADISFTVTVDENEEFGEKVMFLEPRIGGHKIIVQPLSLKYKVIGTSDPVPITAPTEDQGEIRVKIGFEGDPEISASGSFQVYNGSTLLTTLSGGEVAAVTENDGGYQVKAGSKTFVSDQPVRFIPKSSAILKISNYENRPSWDTSLNDNEFRGNLEVRSDDGRLIVINELLLEDYLKGLGEVGGDQPLEKIKAIMIAARSYAKYYMSGAEKFPGKPYHLSDNPDESQKYIGYGFEKRAPTVVSGVNATTGKVVTYNGQIVKTPYFSQSDGIRTKSALEVWGWSNTPYLVSVSDELCEGTEFWGHGVGMSGCGAKAMAENGSSYEEILKHYYTGIEITDLY